MTNEKATRWKLAQEYEANWWQSYHGELEWYREFSASIVSELKPYMAISPEAKMLEIGSGAAGALTFIDSEHKYAVDPLEEMYAGNKQWQKFRDPRVKYYKAMGEDLPFETDFFDLIIIDNVLDHCENPDLVISEMDRVLKFGGFIFFRQNLYSSWGKLMRSAMELLLIDKGHPFTFKRKELLRKFENKNWQIPSITDSGYAGTWIRELKSASINGFVKALFFIVRNKTTFIIEK